MARRHQHSKVLVMLEDEQRSLGALEPVAAILYLPDADAFFFCSVPHHQASVSALASVFPEGAATPDLR
jgi:hypothetical protein